MKTGAARVRCRAHPVRRPLHAYGPICKTVFVGTAVTGAAVPAGKAAGACRTCLPGLTAGPGQGLSIGSETSVALLSASKLVSRVVQVFCPRDGTGRVGGTVPVSVHYLPGGKA